MPENSSARRVLEQDRKVQLKMRLALKRLHGQMPSRPLLLDPDGTPEPELLGRLIAKVRKL